MFKTTKILLMIAAFVLIFGQAIHAMPLTYYQYVTNFERSNQGEIIWFWTPDTMYGHIHSNDFIGLKYSPHFYGPISTSQNRFLEFQASPYFEYNPIFNAPMVEFPQNLSFLRDMAFLSVRTWDNQKMTWIFFRGRQGIDVYQYPRGGQRNDSLYQHLHAPMWDERMIIFVDGDVEVQGTFAGQLTIGCSGNMYLIDDCVYVGANRQGWFEEEEMESMLGLASENNIYIANTIPNGKENGWGNGGNNPNRHSIAINGSLVALGSFTFQHQNDDWENYQGPSPDERGYVYLKGSVAQYRKGYLHRSNHQGSGYGKAFNYDFRLLRDAPPGFAPGESEIIDGRYDQLYLYQRNNYRIRNADIGTLVVYPGIELELEGHQPIVVRNSLIMRGTEDRPITVRPERQGDRTLFRVERGVRSYVELENVIFEESIETQINCDSLKVTNCEFNGPATWEGIIQVRGSKFADEASMSSWHQLFVTHSVFENGLTITGDTPDGHLLNNTIVKGRSAGLRLRRFRSLEIQNNIIAFNRQGINNLHYEAPYLGYNDVFENVNDDYLDCSPGEGAISIDPGFVDLRRGDYNLIEGSPCIDSGNPDSPRDPDGTRADIGAFYFPQPNSVPDIFAPTNAEAFELTAVYPNPFNSATTIGFYLPVKSNVLIRVFDLTGRLQAILVDKETNAGSHKIEWNPQSQSAGMYLVQMQAGEFSSVRKVMLLR